MIKTLTANDHEFTYIEEGSGPPLIFIHGSLLDYRYWTREIAYFAKSFRAIAPSRRHHWPNLPEGDFSYTGQAQSEDMIAFIEALNLGPVHLVGHSYGGYIAAYIATKRPDLLLSLSLMEPGGPVEGQAPGHPPIKEFCNGAKLIKQGNTEAGVAQFLNAVCEAPKWADWEEASKAMTLSNAITITEQITETRSPLSAKALSNLTCPTLLMLSAKALSPFPETIDRIHELRPTAQKTTVPNTTHMINIDNFEGFVSTLEDFLQKASPHQPTKPQS